MSSTRTTHRPSRAFTLLELLAVVAIVGIVSVIVVTRVSSNSAEANINACYLNKGNLEIQAQRWYRSKGTWPASNLSDLAADGAFLPMDCQLAPSAEPLMGSVLRRRRLPAMIISRIATIVSPVEENSHDEHEIGCRAQL